MFSKTQQTLELYQQGFSTLRSLDLYTDVEIGEKLKQIEQRERNATETTKFLHQLVLKHINYLVVFQQEIQERFLVSYPQETMPKQIVIFQQHAVELAFKYLNKSSIGQAKLLVGELSRLKFLPKLQPKFFATGIKLFPQYALFYALYGEYVKDIQQTRMLYQLNYQEIVSQEEMFTFYGNWILFEHQYVKDVLGENDVATIQKEELKNILRGELIGKVIAISIMQIFGANALIELPEQQRIQIIKHFSRSSAWKLALLPSPNDVFKSKAIQQSLDKYIALLPDVSIQFVFEVATQELGQLRDDAEKVLLQNNIAVVSKPIFQQGAEDYLHRYVPNRQTQHQDNSDDIGED